MVSKDSARKEFRTKNGERLIKIPLNGSQKFEIKNISKEKVSVEGDLHSCRFIIFNSLISHRRDYCGFKVDLSPDNSIVFVIKDTGHVTPDPLERPSCFYEGVFRYSAKGFIQSILIRTDPDTESYRQLRRSIDQGADCDYGLFEDDKINEFISVEPISDDKYGEVLPSNVKMLELVDDGERHNAIMRLNHDLARISVFNPFMDGSQCNIANEIVRREDERLRKAQQESNKSSAAPESKRSVTSEKSDAKSLSHDQLTSLASQSKKSEKSEAKSMSQNPKSTLKSEKTTKSEMVQKSEKVDMPELKNEEKKRKKKKKRCVIC
ncbi:unnamed protein product [Caenorhabditis brenneri]